MIYSPRTKRMIPDLIILISKEQIFNTGLDQPQCPFQLVERIYPCDYNYDSYIRLGEKMRTFDGIYKVVGFERWVEFQEALKEA